MSGRGGSTARAQRSSRTPRAGGHAPAPAAAGAGRAPWRCSTSPTLRSCCCSAMELEQRLPGNVTLLMSTAIIMAQLVSIPTALLVGARADRWGRKPLLLAGLRRPAAAGAALCHHRPPGLARGRAGAGRHQPGHARRAAGADPGRHHARHRPLQRRPRRGRHRPGHRRLGQQLAAGLLVVGAGIPRRSWRWRPSAWVRWYWCAGSCPRRPPVTARDDGAPARPAGYRRARG